MYISFAWTAPAFCARRKVCTRRSWDGRYAAYFHKGDMVGAWDKNPRNGGKKIGEIQLTCTPYLERTGIIPSADYENEGFQWMEENGILIRGITPGEFWQNWINTDELVYVVRLEPVRIDPTGGLFKRERQLKLIAT